MKKPRVKIRSPFLVPILALGIFLCAFNAWGIVPDIDTGSIEYWDGDAPAQYVYDVNSGPDVNTGTIDYWDEVIPAQYVYEGDNVSPTCTINKDDPDPTNASSVDFSVDFSETVIGFDQSDIDLTGTAPGMSFTGFTGSGADYTVTVGGISGSGTATIDVDAGKCQDAAGNLNTAGAAVSYTIDRTDPTITGITSTTADGSYKAGDPVNVTINFSENVTLSGGNLVITLETGATDREVTISSITDTNTASGTYMVQAGDTSADLSAISVTLPTGTLQDGVGNDANLSIPGGNNLNDNKNIEIDTTAPTINIGSPSTNLTNTGPVTYTITYSGADTVELDVVDITLDATGGASGSIGVTGNGTEPRTVTISSITGNGTLGITIASGTAADNAGNEAPGAGPSDTFDVDNTAPTATSLVIAVGQANPTNGSTVDFTVNFSEDVTGFDSAGDITVNKSGTSSTGVTITPVSAQEYTVQVTGVSGNGTLGITVNAAAAQDDAGNDNTASAAGPTVTVDQTVPTATVQIAVGQANPTNGNTVDFTVNFSEDVTGFSSSGVTVNKSGTSSTGVTITPISAQGYTVQVTGVSGNGTLGITVNAAAAQDDAGNDNTASAAGPTVTVDQTVPTATVQIATGQANPTNGNTVDFTVNFSEDVTGFDAAGDITVNNSGTSSTGVTITPVSAQEYIVQVTGVSGDGTLGIKVNQGVAQDAAGNDNNASADSPTVTVDHTAPSAPTLALTDQTSASADYTNSQTVNADITEGGDVTAWILSETVTTAPATGSGDWVGSEPTTYTFDSALNELKTVYVWVKDQAGNVYQSAVTDTITLDTESPNAPVITGFDVESQGKITDIRGTVETGCTVHVSIDGSEYLAAEGSGSWTYSTSPALSADYHSIYAYAVDQGENQSANSDTYIGHGIFVNVFQDTDTYHSGSGMVSLRLNKTTVYFYEVAVNESSPVTVSAYLRKNSDYGADTQPKITLTGLGIAGTGAATDSMTEVADTWEQLNVSGTPNAKGVLILKIETYGTADGAKVWIDDISITQ